ncbi:MAG: hypothetical protein AVDCRST_MAG88-2536, partial [uncultured Thermomicrobiales bacterium]
FQLALLLLLAWVAVYIFTRLGYPSLLGELGVGIIFGPPILNILKPSPALSLLGALGTVLLMLLVGARIDVRDLAKASGTALLIAAGAFAASFAVGYFVTTGTFGRSSNEGLIVGVAVSNTALATLPRILLDLGLIEERVGQFLAAVSLFTVAILMTVFAAVDSIVRAGSVDPARLGGVLGRAGLFLLIAVLLGIFVLPRLRPILRAVGLTGRSNSFAVVLLVGILFAGMAFRAGLAVILGGFIAGLFLREDMFGEGEFAAVLTSVEDVAFRFLAPIFFVSAAFPFQFSIFQTRPLELLLMIVLALAGKSLVAFILSRLSPLTLRESAVLAAGMNAKGGVDIVVAQSSLPVAATATAPARTGALSVEMYTVVVCLATVGSLVTPILLKFGRDWLRKSGEVTAVVTPAAVQMAAAMPTDDSAPPTQGRVLR